MTTATLLFTVAPSLRPAVTSDPTLLDLPSFTSATFLSTSSITAHSFLYSGHVGACAALVPCLKRRCYTAPDLLKSYLLATQVRPPCLRPRFSIITSFIGYGSPWAMTDASRPIDPTPFFCLLFLPQCFHCGNEVLPDFPRLDTSVPVQWSSHFIPRAILEHMFGVLWCIPTLTYCCGSFIYSVQVSTKPYLHRINKRTTAVC